MSDPQRPHGLPPVRLLHPWDFPGKITGVGCYLLLQGIFLTQRSNQDLLHWQAIFFFFLLPNHLGRPVLSPNNGTIILLSLLTNRMWHKVMLITPEFRSQNGSPVWLFLSWITCCRGRQEPCCEKLKQPVERTMCGGTGASCQQPASSGQPQETATVETDLPASVKPTF